MACVRKLKYGHFEVSQLEKLSPLVAAVLSDQFAATSETKSLAASVLRQIPPGRHGRSSRNMIPRLLGGREFGTVYKTGLLVDSQFGRVISNRVASQAVADMSREADAYEDAVLPILVGEMLFDPVFDARLYAAFLIYTSSYRGAVARALLIELMAVRGCDDAAWQNTLFEALRILGADITT